MLFQFGNVGVFQTLVDWGFVDAILPFILIFVLIFAILQKVALFKHGEGPDRRINGILALVISAMVVVPHIVRMYPPEADPINMINQFLPQTGVLLLAVLCVMLLLGLAGAGIPSWLTAVVGLIAAGFLVVMILMAVMPGFFPSVGFLSDPATQALLIVLLTMGLIGWFIIREPEQRQTGQPSWLDEWFFKPR